MIFIVEFRISEILMMLYAYRKKFDVSNYISTDTVWIHNPKTCLQALSYK